MQQRVLTCLVLLLLSLATAQSEKPAGSQPNILLIVIDNLNDWVGCLGGHPQSLTPNIDALAQWGTEIALTVDSSRPIMNCC